MSATLNAANLPLQGRHLIEASAGTGKTFTVANLYLRLLIDAQNGEPPKVENILVVTFTKAATEELRARLRSRIAVALQVLEGDSTDDKTLSDVLDPHRNEPDTKKFLELAYQSMDQAAIFTIHGFCDRVLREQAFESGELFDAELQTDVDDLKLKAAQAWWRTNITPMSTADTESIPGKWRTPGAVLKRLSPVINDPDGLLVPQFTDAEMRDTQDRYQSSYQSFCAAWDAEGAIWAEQVLVAVESKLINKGKDERTYTRETVEKATQVAATLAQLDTAPTRIDPCLLLLGNVAVRESKSGRKKNEEAPESTLGDRIDALLAIYKQIKLQNLVALQNNARDTISAELAQRKLLARQRTFDDLLFQLHAVLTGANGDRLTNLLRTRYPVALIDEFQDTDRIQFEIFDKLFPMQPDSDSALYLIGDPKQAIYRFRGADIDIYLRARDSADKRHSLDKNWRSSSQLLNALNALYAQSDRPFGNADIQYQEVTAGGRAEGRALTVGGNALPPLQFDYMEVTDENLPTIDLSIGSLARNCAQRVAWLLADGNATLGCTPVAAKDIAVLVGTHIHADAMRQALLDVGVASAMQSRESVFSTQEALDVLALLRVLARPGDSTSLSRVLVSPLGGYSAQELLQQRDDAVEWQRIEDRVQRCREQCKQAGPQAAMLRFMSLFNSRIKALGTAVAESRGIDRILGNYLHLADVLQAAWQEQPELSALLKTAQRWREQDGDDALQMRLESDESLVQIVTIHKSKGLQYPVVILPFACIGRDPKSKDDFVLYTENGIPRLDVGTEQLEDRRTEALQSETDESLRQLYVALTRAEQSCWIGMAANKNATHAALSQLLGLSLPSGKGTADCQEPITTALNKLADSCPDISVVEALTNQPPLPTAELTDATKLARTATRYVQADWRVSSFTGLARGATHTAERPDHDAEDVAPVTKPDKEDHNSPFHFPRGADAGTLIHSVFEHLDFRITSDQDLKDYAEKKLRDHAVDEQWTPALCQLVRNTLDAKLDQDDFTLSILDKKDRLDELGFHFPVKSLDADKLVGLLREFKVFLPEDDLSFANLKGYMSGYIDLIFRHKGRWYIADYKSNHLGYETTDYHQNALQEAMQHHRYDLQYLIYTVALRRYLSSRMPDFKYDNDFGGVYYLFVRGMSATPEAEATNGVFARRPPADLIQALDELLGGETQNA